MEIAPEKDGHYIDSDSVSIPRFMVRFRTLTHDDRTRPTQESSVSIARGCYLIRLTQYILT